MPSTTFLLYIFFSGSGRNRNGIPHDRKADRIGKTGDATNWYHYDSAGNPYAAGIGGTRYYFIRNLQGDVTGLIGRRQGSYYREREFISLAEFKKYNNM